MSTLQPRYLEKFDCTKQDHLQSFKRFIENSHWDGGCPFVVEYPWNNVPDMIKDKIARHYLSTFEWG